MFSGETRGNQNSKLDFRLNQRRSNETRELTNLVGGYPILVTNQAPGRSEGEAQQTKIKYN